MKKHTIRRAAAAWMPLHIILKVNENIYGIFIQQSDNDRPGDWIRHTALQSTRKLKQKEKNENKR